MHARTIFAGGVHIDEANEEGIFGHCQVPGDLIEFVAVMPLRIKGQQTAMARRCRQSCP
jgi:hypothetical protein